MDSSRKPTTAKMASMVMNGLWNQSRFLPRSSMVCRLNTQKVSRKSPTVSMRSLRVGVSRLFSIVQLMKPVSRPSGTLIRKIQPQ